MVSVTGKFVWHGLLVVLGFVGAVSARAAPPPPPNQEELKVLQSYISGLDQGRPEAYQSALADNVNVIVDDQVVATSKSEWMRSILARFNLGYNQNVTVEHVYYGFVAPKVGEYANRAILMERVDRISGDCCVFHRVETLTFRKGLVASIRRSPELNLQLRPDGHTQSEPPLTRL